LLALFSSKIIFLQPKLKFTKMSDIATRVKKIIVDKLGVEEAEVTNEASFTNDLGADSLDTVELIMEFEKESIFQFRTNRPRPSPQLARPLATWRSMPSKELLAMR